MGAKKKEMERLVKIFTGCIEQHENYELLYSKKLACYLLLELNSYRKDVEDTGCYYEPKKFCRKMFEIIAQDAFALSEFEHDEPDEQELMEMLADYKGTVVMVSHNRDEVYRFSEELLIIDQGKIAVSGKTKEIFENPVSKEAARLTGCKNFSRACRLDAHTAEALDWGITLHTSGEIPEDTPWIGYRAHDFVPVWGEGGENMLKFDLESSAELPFEHNYYIKAGETVCWFIQREKMRVIEERGLPDYLRLEEEKMLFLK